jgi:hypothetical protein
MIRTLTLLAVIAGAALAMPNAVLADERSRHSGHGHEGFKHSSHTSVFPQPRDPYRSWGVRTELPRRVGHPHFHNGGFHRPTQVWVPGQWAPLGLCEVKR